MLFLFILIIMPTFIKELPIYSVAVYKFYIYLSGGGGGRTGIANEILIYKRKIDKQPLKSISTEDKIVQNMTINESKNIMVCSQNENILLFSIQEQGLSLNQLMCFQGDFCLRNSNINAIFFHPLGEIFSFGGDDKVLKFFSLSFQNSQPIPELIWEHDEHPGPIRNIDYNGFDLYVSSDKMTAVISNLKNKQIIRKVYNDQLLPQSTFLQSAYFESRRNSSKLVICHYLHAKQTFITKQKSDGKLTTLAVNKDQSCLTAKESNYVGIACGNGSTFMIDVQSMEIVGKKHDHNSIITAATLTRGKRFITGTSSCSYLIQEANHPLPTFIWAIILTFVLIFVTNKSFFKQISQEL